MGGHIDLITMKEKEKLLLVVVVLMFIYHQIRQPTLNWFWDFLLKNNLETWEHAIRKMVNTTWFLSLLLAMATTDALMFICTILMFFVHVMSNFTVMWHDAFFVYGTCIFAAIGDALAVLAGVFGANQQSPYEVYTTLLVWAAFCIQLVDIAVFKNCTRKTILSLAFVTLYSYFHNGINTQQFCTNILIVTFVVKNVDSDITAQDRIRKLITTVEKMPNGTFFYVCLCVFLIMYELYHNGHICVNCVMKDGSCIMQWIDYVIPRLTIVGVGPAQPFWMRRV